MYFEANDDVRTFESPIGPPIQILSFPRVFQGCEVFCSLGLSHYITSIGLVGEMYCPVDSGWDVVPLLLADAIFQMVGLQMKLQPGFAFRNIERVSKEFADKSKKAALYFSRPVGLPDGFTRVTWGEQSGYMFLVSLISEAEFNYLRRVGSVEFEKMLESRRVDTINVMRDTAISA